MITGPLLTVFPSYTDCTNMLPLLQQRVRRELHCSYLSDDNWDNIHVEIIIGKSPHDTRIAALLYEQLNAIHLQLGSLTLIC